MLSNKVYVRVFTSTNFWGRFIKELKINKRLTNFEAFLGGKSSRRNGQSCKGGRGHTQYYQLFQKHRRKPNKIFKI